MILTVAAFLSALGLVTWVLGYYLRFTGMAVIGAVLLLGVGAMVMIDGLEHSSGEIETQADDGTIERQTIYDQVDTGQSFPLGALLTILAGVLVMRSLNQQAEASL